MKYVLLCLLFLTACGERPKDKEGRIKTSYAENCVNGVVYYYYFDTTAYAMAPKFTKDGKVVPCD